MSTIDAYREINPAEVFKQPAWGVEDVVLAGKEAEIQPPLTDLESTAIAGLLNESQPNSDDERSQRYFIAMARQRREAGFEIPDRDIELREFYVGLRGLAAFVDSED